MSYLDTILQHKADGKVIIVVTEHRLGFIPSEIERSADVLVCAGKLVKDRQGNHVVVTI